jgi:hypothetical protein
VRGQKVGNEPPIHRPKKIDTLLLEKLAVMEYPRREQKREVRDRRGRGEDAENHLARNGEIRASEECPGWW